MTQEYEPADSGPESRAGDFDVKTFARRRWRKALSIGGILLVACLAALGMLWSAFFVYVPQGKHLVVITNYGDPLAPGQVLADEGQMGMQRQVKGEGWHF